MSTLSLYKSAARLAGRNSAAARSFVSTAVRAGGAKHDDHGHDDHHHHSLFEVPFKKSTIGTIVWGSLFGGVSLLLISSSFQNRKHGFAK